MNSDSKIMKDLKKLRKKSIKQIEILQEKLRKQDKIMRCTSIDILEYYKNILKNDDFKNNDVINSIILELNEYKNCELINYFEIDTLIAIASIYQKWLDENI